MQKTHLRDIQTLGVHLTAQLTKGIKYTWIMKSYNRGSRLSASWRNATVVTLPYELFRVISCRKRA